MLPTISMYLETTGHTLPLDGASRWRRLPLRAHLNGERYMGVINQFQ